MKVLGLIPARGGSKGIPGKNLVPLGGKPLIAHSIDAAKASATISLVMVSTDSDEIAAACEAHGVAVPRRRTPQHATDSAGMLGVALEALDWCCQDGDEIDMVVLLQPTSPLRNAADIDGTVAAMRAAGVESAISVHMMTEHPAECVEARGRDWNFLVNPPQGAAGRQNYQRNFFFVNGAVYAVSPRFLRQNSSFFLEGPETALYEMDRLRGVDINDWFDLNIANALLAASA
jgi:CMP-N,N'-diacetyllegionaminic acid synthase